MPQATGSTARVAEQELPKGLLGGALISRLLSAGPGDRGNFGDEVEALVRVIVGEIRTDAVQDPRREIDQHR